MKRKNNLVQVYGKHPVTAALLNKNRIHRELVTTREILSHLEGILPRYDLKTTIKTPKEIDVLAPNATHQNILLYTSSIISRDSHILKKISKKEKSAVIALDQVTDPQNIGAIIRSALAFNIDALILPEHTAPDETPSMAKASSGAIEKLPIIKVKNLTNTIKSLQKENYWAIGLDSNTSALINKHNFGEKTVLIMGSEGKGMRRLTKETCDLVVKLPMSGNAESLNVSNAAAIAMYELFKNIG
jgi:23S rRNA (guanosine2251-2'-O)-methyltransferase